MLLTLYNNIFNHKLYEASIQGHGTKRLQKPQSCSGLCTSQPQLDTSQSGQSETLGTLHMRDRQPAHTDILAGSDEIYRPEKQT